MSADRRPLYKRSLLLLTVGVACSDPGGTPADPPTPSSDVVWHLVERGSTTKPGVDTSGKTIFFYNGRHELVALDAATGRVKWRTLGYDNGGKVFGKDISVAGDVVAIGDIDVFAFRASTGERLWTHGRYPGGNEGERTIASDGRHFYLAGVDGLLSKVDALTGEDVWVRSLAHGDTAVVAFGPAVHGKRVFVCTNRYQHRGVPVDRGALSAIDTETGSLLWRVYYEPVRADAPSWCFSPVAAVNGFVVGGVSDGRVIAHDPATGAVRWTTPGEFAENFWESIHVSSDGSSLISVSSASRVTRHDPVTGAVMWRGSGGIGSPLNPAAVDANTVAVTHSGAVITYDLSSGAVLWVRPDDSYRNMGGGTAPYSAYAEPLLHNGIVYFNASDGLRAKRPR